MLVLDGLGIGLETLGASTGDQRAFLNRLATLLEFSDCTALVNTLSPGGVLGGQDAVYDPVQVSLRALAVSSGYVGYEHAWSRADVELTASRF